MASEYFIQKVHHNLSDQGPIVGHVGCIRFSLLQPTMCNILPRKKQHTVVVKAQPQSSLAWIWILDLTLASYVTSGKLLHGSVPPFPHLQNGDDDDDDHGTVVEGLNVLIQTQHWNQCVAWRKFSINVNHYYHSLRTFSRSKKEHIKLTVKSVKFFSFYMVFVDKVIEWYLCHNMMSWESPGWEGTKTSLGLLVKELLCNLWRVPWCHWAPISSYEELG